MSYVVNSVSPSAYLRDILAREAVDNGSGSRLRALEGAVGELCARWAGRHFGEIYPVGGFEKGAANRSGVAIDFVVSLSPQAPFGIAEIYQSLFTALRQQGYAPVRRDVSICIVADGVAIDLVPAKRQSVADDMHEIYSLRRERPIRTNLTQHVLDAMEAGHREEVRVLKLWRDQQGLDFPSFYLELSTEAALRRRPPGELADNVWAVLGYLETVFVARALLDPANAANVVSEELAMAQRFAIAEAAAAARSGRPWSEIVT